MKSFFEYLYYRIAKLNFIKNYERAIISVTICQLLIITNLFIFVKKSFNILHGFTSIETFIFIGIYFILNYYNFKIYKDRFEEFDSKWGNESKDKKVIGMIKIISFIILCWGLFFINGWIFNRYK